MYHYNPITKTNEDRIFHLVELYRKNKAALDAGKNVWRPRIESGYVLGSTVGILISFRVAELDSSFNRVKLHNTQFEILWEHVTELPLELKTLFKDNIKQSFNQLTTQHPFTLDGRHPSLIQYKQQL